jgi:glucosamine-phosphate N-acetyltransferase
MELAIRELTGPDLGADFLETLASLAEVDLGRDTALAVFRERLRAGIRTFVAVLDRRIVGTLTLFVEQKFIHHGGKVGHIEDVVVEKSFQRKGIGQALVLHATAEARKLGCYKVILCCFEDRVPFYEGVGFRRHDVGMRIDLNPLE